MGVDATKPFVEIGVISGKLLISRTAFGSRFAHNLVSRATF